MAVNTVILHYHIFKNAGTSFNNALHAVFGDSFMEFDGSTASSTIPPDQIADIIRDNPQRSAFSTHQGMLPPPELPDCRVMTTLLLRHPLSRISSIYHFERIQDSQSPGAINAKRLSFGDYLRWRWDQSPAFFCFQAFFCARSTAHPGFRPLDTLAERALANLAKVDCVGTVEQYDSFLRRCTPLVAAILPGAALAQVHANASSAPPMDHDAILRRIETETDSSFVDQISAYLDIDTRLWSGFLERPSAANESVTS